MGGNIGRHVGGAAAHDIPTDVKINAFIKPEGHKLELLIRVPLAAMIEVDFPPAVPAISTYRAPTTRCATPQSFISSTTSLSTKTALRCRRPGSSTRGYRSNRTSRSRPTSRRSHTWRRRRWRAAWTYTGSRDCSMRCSNIPSAPTGPTSRSGRGSSGLGGRHHRAALPSARRTDAGVRVPQRSGPRAARSALAPGGLALGRVGFSHILEGADHLLFLLCLVVPFRRLRPLMLIVTSFTIGHSISLIASAFGTVPDALWFPPLIETLIAVTILYMALENIVYAAMGTLASDLSRRWIIAFAFGIVHGYGFSFALRERCNLPAIT